MIERSILNLQFSTNYLALCLLCIDSGSTHYSTKPFICVKEQKVVKATIAPPCARATFAFYSLSGKNILQKKENACSIQAVLLKNFCFALLSSSVATQSLDRPRDSSWYHFSSVDNPELPISNSPFYER